MNILVTGGAGYIGSFVVRRLVEEGHNVAVVDDLSNGHRSSVHPAAKFYRGNIGDRTFLRFVFKKQTFGAVMHFAARVEAELSMEAPDEFFETNVMKSAVFLDTMLAHGVKKFIFSSSAAVYGSPKIVPILETAPKKPTNVYGLTKLMFEEMLPKNSVILRYFNACGASRDGKLGERHNPETHLIPRILAVAKGQRPYFKLFGTDYDTPDGTCVRDFVHVEDIAAAHLAALRFNLQGLTLIYNVGLNRGFSVREVIRATEKVTGKKIPIKTFPRRPGDPAKLIADASKIRRELHWKPKYTSLEAIIETAWRYQQVDSRLSTCYTKNTTLR